MQKHLDLYNKLIQFFVTAILIAVPLYQKFPLFKIPQSQVSIRLEDLLIAVAIALLAFVKRKEVLSLLKNKLIQYFLLFWIITFLSLVYAIIVTKTVVLSIGFLHWARRIEYMSVFFLGYYALNSKKDIKFYLKIFALVVVFAFLYGAGQKYLNWPVITTQNSEYAKGVALKYLPGGHLVSTFAGHYDMASYLILVLPFLFLSILYFKNIFSKTFFSLSFLSGLWLLMQASSRISIVSYMGSIILALIISKKIKFIPLIIVVSILFMSFSSNLIDRYMRIIKVTLTKIADNHVTLIYAQENVLRVNTETPTPSPLAIFEDRSTSIRLNVEWPRALRALEKNPVLGTGYSSIGLAIDNDYLRMLGEIGLLGFFSFLLIMLKIVFEMFNVLPLDKNNNINSMFIVSVFSALFGIALNMVFIDILEASKFAIIFWLTLGLSLSSLKYAKNE